MATEQVNEIATEFFSKALHIILGARVPSLDRGADSAGINGTSQSPGSKEVDKWFNMENAKVDVVTGHIETWQRRTKMREPLVIDILLIRQKESVGDSSPYVGRSSRSSDEFDRSTSLPSVSQSGSCNSASINSVRRHAVQPPPGEGLHSVSNSVLDSHEGEGVSSTLLERWVVKYEGRRRGGAGGGSRPSEVRDNPWLDAGAVPGNGDPSSPPIEVPVIYKHTVILMRSLYCMARTLPAYRLFQLARSSSQNKSFQLCYRISSFPPRLAEVDTIAMSTWRLTPVNTPRGRLCLSVAARHTTTVSTLEAAPPLLPRIIADYVGSPTTNPLRRFSQQAQVAAGWASTSPGGRRGVPPPAQSIGRRHSWEGGAAKGSFFPHAHVEVLSGSSAAPEATADSLPASPRGPRNWAFRSPPSSSGPSAPFQGSSTGTRAQASVRSPSSSPSPPWPSGPLPEPASPVTLPRSTSAPVSIPRSIPKAYARGWPGEPTLASPSRSRSSSREHYPPQPPQSAPNSGGTQASHPSTRGFEVAAGTKPLTSYSPPSLSHRSSSVGQGALLKARLVRNEQLAKAPGAMYGEGTPAAPLGTSPSLPFASSPVAASPLFNLSPPDGSMSRISGSPPISGRQKFGQELARLPSMSHSTQIRDATLVEMRNDPENPAGAALAPQDPLFPQQESGHMCLDAPSRRMSLYGEQQGLLSGRHITPPVPSGADADDEDDFALPFAVDDVDGDFRSRSGGANSSWAKSLSAGTSSQGTAGQSEAASRQAQESALGALVLILKNAAPLRVNAPLAPGEGSDPWGPEVALQTSPEEANCRSSDGVGTGNPPNRTWRHSSTIGGKPDQELVGNQVAQRDRSLLSGGGATGAAHAVDVSMPNRTSSLRGSKVPGCGWSGRSALLELQGYMDLRESLRSRPMSHSTASSTSSQAPQ